MNHIKAWRQFCLHLVTAIALSLAMQPAQARSVLKVTSPETGVHVMGGDKAEFTLTEYVSYTCSHCAHFEKEAGDKLRVFYVGSGRMKLEVRHVVRDPFDLVVAMLANCGPASRFDRNHAMFLREQPVWLGILLKATQAQTNRYNSGSYPVRRQAVARDAGFYAMMQRRGYERAEVDRCLADETMAKALADKSQTYVEQRGVHGTPSFAIDDVVLAGTHDWQTLKFQLDLRL